MRAVTRGQLALVYLCLLAGFTSCCDVSTFRGGEFSGCAKLDDNYDLYWKLEQQDIIFAFSVRNNIGGWIGLGISENGGMKGADIMVAQKVKGAYVMEDRFAQEYSLPQLDKHSDVTLISAEEDSDTTTIVFKRALVTCDGSQDNPISENVKWVIFAYGPGELQYHGASRGTREINFFEDIKPVLPSDSQVLSVLAPPFEVPAKETTYACSAHVLPHDQKYHIVHVNPLQRSSLVHHIVAYECHGPAPENITRAGTADCETDFEYCGDGIFWVVWGLGGGPIDYAGDYAVPMGKDNTVYIKLEIHYYNPTGISGLVDSSGLEFTYTTQLRKYDLGVLTVGTDLTHITIPPHMPHTDVVNECPSDCTSKFPGTLNVIGILPHMHLAGSKFLLQQIRDGVEMEPIYQTNYYDFGMQHIYDINRTIAPGDRLISLYSTVVLCLL